MKDVRAPGVIEPVMVRLAPYITTAMTDRVDAAFTLPKNIPTTFCSRKNAKNKCCNEGLNWKDSEEIVLKWDKRALTACLSPRFSVSLTFSE